MSGSTSRIRTMFQKNCRIRTMFRMMSCGQEGSDKVTRKGGKHGRGGEAHQPLSQLKPSRRRLRAPSTPPVIDSWSVIAVTCDESESSAAFRELPTAGRREQGEVDEHSAHRFGRGGRAMGHPHR